MSGPRVRTDIVDVYVFRRPGPGAIEFLQLRRAGGRQAGAWHPIMGHVQGGETAASCAFRELGEEVGLDRTDGALLGVWALEQVNPFYIAETDEIVLSPRFAAEVRAGWTPELDDEHDGARWVGVEDVQTSFVWPGQMLTLREIVGSLLCPGSASEPLLRLHPSRG